jgi:RNA polymerase sigma factor (sigma-70 family)
MRENPQSILETFIKHTNVTQVESTEWGNSCLEGMRNGARKVLLRYPCWEQEVEDAVNSALTSVLDKIRHNRGAKIEDPKGYLITSAVNKAITRAKQLNKRSSDSSFDEDSFDLADRNLSHSEVYEIQVMYMYYRRGLSDIEKAVADMTGLLRMTNAEIASALNISEEKAYALRYKVRRKLSPLKGYLKR